MLLETHIFCLMWNEYKLGINTREHVFCLFLTQIFISHEHSEKDPP